MFSYLNIHAKRFFQNHQKIFNFSSVPKENFPQAKFARSVYIAALDQGTSSTRAIIYDQSGHKTSSHSVNLNLITPHPGWAEQDPIEIIETCRTCLRNVVDVNSSDESGLKLDSLSIKALGIANQRETTIIWDKYTGKPLYNSIVWSDVRTAQIVEELDHEFGSDYFISKTGLPISTYFSATKIYWLIKNVPEVKEAIEQKRALFGTVDTWIIWNLTGGIDGGVHVTDISNASRTMLFNLHELGWDKDICSILGIPTYILPQIKSNSELLGIIKFNIEYWDSVPITASLGDQHAALVGQKCFSSSSVKATYGTGCFVLCNTGEKAISSNHHLLTTIAYKLGPNEPVKYALEGSIPTAGSGINWLCSNMNILKNPQEIGPLASTVANSGGVYFVPALSGLLAPWWDPTARGTLVGLTHHTNRGHIARAMIEAIAFQVTDIVSAMEIDYGNSLEGLKVDGGLVNSDLILQVQSDYLNKKISRSFEVESTARGAAFAAGKAIKLLTESFLDQEMKSFTPNLDDKTRSKKIEHWHKAVEKSLRWEEFTEGIE